MIVHPGFSGVQYRAYNGIEVVVTPRRLRAAEEQASEAQLTWREKAQSVQRRESTPERALRKLTRKIKRSLNNAARGEHDAIAARAPRSEVREGKGDSTANLAKAAAIGQLDDPAALKC